MAERATWDERTGIATGVDWEDRAPDQSEPLPEEQKAELLARIRSKINPTKTYIQKATHWVLMVFSWMLVQSDPAVPVHYAARFEDIVSFVEKAQKQRKDEELQAEAEEILDGE